MEGVAIRLRLVSEDQVRAIRDANLHEELVGRCNDEAIRALDATQRALETHDEDALGEVVELLAKNLAQMTKLRAVVAEAVATGGTVLNEEQFFAAMAAWIVDNQLDAGLKWDPSAALRRR